MSDHDRFRGQDLDDEYSGDDDMSAAMGGYDESAMQQDQGGRAPYGQGDAYSSAWDEYSSDMGDGARGGREDESGAYEDEFPDDETGAGW